MASPKSKRMADKPKFLDKYNKCSDKIRDLLDEITKQLSNKSCFADWGYTNSPDLRFSCAGMGFCRFILRPPYQMTMYIRVDDLVYVLALEKAGLAGKFSVAEKCGFKGRKWIKTELYENTPMPPLISFVNELCKDRELNGW